MNKLNKVTLTAATCGLDLGDGSERAEYVNQDYILNTLGRPHRNIGIMYTYYPKDKEWPERISVACKDMEIHFQWDYPYDDYFPYRGGIDGDTTGQPFEQMRDIRRHGQDVALTLTIDCSLEDQYLRQIAQDLKPFGRMRLRINHECGGDWFTHNQRFLIRRLVISLFVSQRSSKRKHRRFLLYFVEVPLATLVQKMPLFNLKKSSKKLLQLQISGRMTAIWHCITDGRLTYVKRAVTAML